MIVLGLIIDIILPSVADPSAEWMPETKNNFVIPCFLSDLLAGANSFAITWVVRFRRIITIFTYTDY